MFRGIPLIGDFLLLKRTDSRPYCLLTADPEDLTKELVIKSLSMFCGDSCTAQNERLIKSARSFHGYLGGSKLCYSKAYHKLLLRVAFRWWWFA